MTNVIKLRALIENSGLKMQFIAEQLGMTPQGLYKKLKDKSDWSFSKVMIMKELLKIPDEDITSIFFASKVD